MPGVHLLAGFGCSIMTATAPLEFAQRVAELLGVPLVTCEPGGKEFVFPSGERDSLSAADNANQLRRWQPGWAVMVRTGGPVVVVDVDPRNCGDIERTRQLLDGLGVQIFAEIATPSGGRHFYIAGHPELPSCSSLDGWRGIDVLSFGKLVYLPGTQRPKYQGAGYEIVFDNIAALADGGDPDGAEAFADWVAGRRAKPERFDTSPPWTGGEPDEREARYLTTMLKGIHADLAAMGKNSGRNTKAYTAGLKCGNYIAGAGLDEQTAIDMLLDASNHNGLVKEDGQRSVLASIRSGIKNGRNRPRAVPPPKTTKFPPTTLLPDDVDVKAVLGALLAELRTWQHLPDPTHVIAALATAATKNADGEPCWLLLVAPPSSGKTEAVRLLDDIANARLNEVTAAGLLSWSKGKNVKPSGILSRIGKRALVTFGDLSSLLATSDRGGRDQVFGLLRRVYDGHVTRDIAPPGKHDGDQRLSWSGRLTVVACVTGAIDRYTAHADQLGPRWLEVRIPERTTEQKRQASQLTRRSDLSSHRSAAREAVAKLLARLPTELPELPDEVADDIEDAALVTTWGRAAVPRNGYGRREIEDVPVIEEPMRLVQQLGGIARGVLALGLPATAAAAIARRLALDSIPAARHAVLKALSTGEVLSTASCARAAGLDRKVARMALEELAAIGVVENDRGDEEDNPVGVVNWRLSGDDGEVITQVFEAHRASGGGWDETWVYTSTSPQIKEEGRQHQHGG
jgi:hypothetical protein